MSRERTAVLVVDDDQCVRKTITNSLEALSYQCESATNAQEAEEKLAETLFPLVFLDIWMPGTSGLDLLPRIKEHYPDTMVIMITGLSDLNVAVEAMKRGAEDYITKPVNLDHLKLSAERALEKRQLVIEHREHDRRLEEMVKEQTREITQQRDTIAALYGYTVAALATALEAKDRYTEGHSKRVAHYGLRMAREIGLPSDQLHEIEIGGLLHDIGKIGIPDAILNKKGKLTEEEFAKIKKHPTIGSTIVSNIPRISDIVFACIRHHHERWDGKGYPDALAGKVIPLVGRILAIADAFDAMTSSRSYRPTMSVRQALDEVRGKAGTQFDPEIAQIWLELMSYDQGSGANILVVDDDAQIRTFFEETLMPLGQRVVTAAGADRAVQCIKEEPFDLIFLDVRMPGFDGVTALSEIKRYRPDAFAVIITGFPDDPRVGEMMRLGAYKCLPKPFDFRELKKLIGEALQKL
ncbi:MAG: response regulator [Candidatus Tectomicrobia bacterium]|nr:response regulator [Candidatus Tectomicrobia bacterium]